jgi:hypothetical protein
MLLKVFIVLSWPINSTMKDNNYTRILHIKALRLAHVKICIEEENDSLSTNLF